MLHNGYEDGVGRKAGTGLLLFGNDSLPVCLVSLSHLSLCLAIDLFVITRNFT